MADADRTRRVAAAARKKILSHVQYIPHDYHDTSSTAGQSASHGEGMDSEGKDKHLHMDSLSEQDHGSLAADVAPGKKTPEQGSDHEAGPAAAHQEMGESGPSQSRDVLKRAGGKPGAKGYSPSSDHAHDVGSGGEDLDGGPEDHMDAGSAGPHGRQHDSTRVDAHRGGNEAGSLNADPSSSDHVEGEDGESGAARGHDLLGPNLQRSKTIRALTDAYSRRRK